MLNSANKKLSGEVKVKKGFYLTGFYHNIKPVYNIIKVHSTLPINYGILIGKALSSANIYCND